jgi:uncharacterized membrane protein YiaA
VKTLKDFWLVIGGYVMHLLSFILDELELEDLQKIFYLLSILLLLLGIWQVLAKRKRQGLDKVTRLEKTNNLVRFVYDPEHKGEIVLRTIDVIKIKTQTILYKGGKKMKEFLRSRGWVQWVSLVMTFVLLIVGILSAFVPELAQVGENIVAYLITLGFVSAPGILAKGKLVGDAIKQLLPAKERKLIEASIKAWYKKLDDLSKKYADVIEIAKDVAELGGTLTQEQQTQYNTYITQKNAIDAKIEAEKKKLEVPQNG